MQYSCPICKRRLSSNDSDKEPFFPFCSERCQLIDLGKWLQEEYGIPGKEEGDKGEEPGSNDGKKGGESKR